MTTNSTKRACGGCTLCCFTYDVRDDGKQITRSFDWCTHCDIGLGCKIHETTQPSVCAQWLCAWRDGLGSDDERPDKTGVVPEWRYTRQGKTLVLIGSTSDSLESDYARNLTKTYAKRRVPIIHMHPDGRKYFVYEQDVLVDADVAMSAKREKVGILFVDTTAS
ncbi:MAG: hypothetical protein Athens041674_98 [Parcubacteria group bacterium Athens0416_74]|nr:MAG: hypothetical protein Athens041674_98 [Parcubacteria group bacterium Athens0416_74]